MVPFKLLILGSSSATPTSERNPSAQLLLHGDKMLLIDCGEGTQMALRRNHIHFQKISRVFISHLHGDHFFGLVGLVSSMHLLGRTQPLHVYGPPMLRQIIELQLTASQTTLLYPLEFHATQAEQPEIIFEDSALSVTTFPLLHRVPTTGFLFKEKPSERHINKRWIEKLDIPIQHIRAIKAGEDYTDKNGKLYPNSLLTTEPDPIRAYAYCSDTAYFEDIIPVVKGVDLLYHEATFMNDKRAVAAEKQHATTGQAATIAAKADVKKLLIGHYSARYKEIEPMLAEAREVFPNTEAAVENEIFEV